MFKSFLAALAIVWASFFGGHATTASDQPAAVAVAAPTNQTAPTSAAGTSASVPSTLPAPQLFPAAAPASGQPKNISAAQYANTAAAGQVLGTSTQTTYITQEELTAQLQQATNALQSVIYQNDSAPNSLPASGGYTNDITMSSAIDQLNGTTLNNVTVNGVSGLTAAEIPSDIVAANYLPLAGGTLTGALLNSSTASSSFLGALGIGTTSPSDLFAVNGPIYLADISPSATTNRLYSNGGSLYWAGSLVGGGSVGNWTTSGGNVYRASGNVGIGTTSPFAALSVQGSGFFSGNVSVANIIATGTLTAFNILAAASSTIGNGTQTGGLTISGGATTTGNAYFGGNVSIGTRLSLSPTNGITDTQISSAAVPGLIRGNNANSVSTAPVSATPVAPYIYFHQVQGGSWSNGIVTLTLRTGTTDNYVGNGVDFITISGSTNTAYNGTFPLVAATSNTVSYNLATNPGTYTGGSDGGYTDTNLEPTVQIQPNSPFGTALFLTSNPNCVPDGQDVAAPILAVSSGYHNYTWEIGCDAHSVSIWAGGYRKDFSNGYTNSWTSDHLVAWTNSPTADPDTSTNDDTSFSRVAAGTLGVGTGSQGSIAGTLLAGSVGIGTSTPYSKLTVWGPDAASSTLAFNVVNNAFTTVFAVFDGGNAQLSGTLTQNSDQRLKTNIESLDASSTLTLIDQLNPVTFNWIDPNQGNGIQVGFIAQQVQAIFPELVSTTSATALTPGGTLGLNYIGLVAPAISAIQALSSEVQNLIAEVQGFAQSFTSAVGNFGKVNTQQLCIIDSAGTPICVTGDQLAALLAGQLAPTSSSEVSIPASTTTPPTITIMGNNPAIIEVGENYSDLGAIAKDSAGNDLGLKYFLNGALVSNIVLDTSAVATDTIDYVSIDTYGNTATSTRTVIVEAAPNTNTTTTAATSTSQ
jgi:hypothetical protein